MSKDKTVAFKVPEQKLKEIGREADASGLTIAGWVRQIVYEHLSKKAA